MAETQGDIHITYTVDCPNCNYHHDDYYDRDWFNNTMGDDFPIDDGYDSDYDAECKECKHPFIIKGFVH